FPLGYFTMPMPDFCKPILQVELTLRPSDAGSSQTGHDLATRRDNSLASEVHPHLRRHVFDRLPGYVDQGLLHRPGEWEWRFVVSIHDRRTCVGADANTCRQAQLQGYRYRQIAVTDHIAVDEQLDACGNTFALGDIGFARRRKLEAEDVIALWDFR